jgi:hypothetical protein
VARIVLPMGQVPVGRRKAVTVRDGRVGRTTSPLLILDHFRPRTSRRATGSPRTGQQMAADPPHLVFPLPPRASADRTRFRRQFCPKAEELPRPVKG